jgi:hypothetical protein
MKILFVILFLSHVLSNSFFSIMPLFCPFEIFAGALVLKSGTN